MYLPRNLISHLYLQLLKSHHPLSPPVLILVALEPDALCACRILTALLKRDYIPHKIHPVGGYGDLTKAGEELVKPMRLGDGGSGGVVVCLGVGGLVDLESILGLEIEEDGTGGCDGVDIWVFDARRPWNLSNIFGGAAAETLDPDGVLARRANGVEKGEVQRSHRPGKGGIIVFDDGDIQEELATEKEAWFALEDMPELDDADADVASDSEDEDAEDADDSSRRKRKSWSDGDEEEGGDDADKENEERPRQRRRSNSSTPIPSSPLSPSRALNYQSSDILQSTPPSNQLSSPLKAAPAQPSARSLRKKFLKIRRKHEETIRAYYALGTSYAEPISSLMYSLASELGREDNDLLWLSIIGVSSTELYGRTSTGVSLTDHDRAATVFAGWTGSRGSRIRQILRDEVRRLNPPELTETGREVTRGMATDAIPTYARSPTDTSIRLSPEPRFLLLRHWSLYDSMLHSPYLSAKLHIWSDAGRKRLAKLLAKMGVSLVQCKQSYTHMDMDLKKDLRQKLLAVAPMYGLDGLVPPPSVSHGGADKEGWGFVRCWGWKACLSAADVAVIIGAILEVGTNIAGMTIMSNGQLPTPRHSPSSSNASEAGVPTAAEEALARFYDAYDALLSPTALTHHIPLAQSLHRAILRTGTSLLQKRQLRHLRAFRMALVKEGPDVPLFTNPGALMKLALWVGEAIKEVEKDDGKSRKKGKGGATPLVLGCIDESRGVYVVVGLGGGGGAMGKTDAERKEKEKKRKEKEEKRTKAKEAKAAAKRKARADKGEDVDGDDDEEEEDAESEDEESEGSSDEDSSDEDEEGVAKKKSLGRNRFGNAFQEVVEETSARVRLDSFEHCVVEVKKEDLSGFLESLSMKAVVG